MSVYVEVTNGISESEVGAIEITRDGDAIVKTGSFSQGQGHETTFAQIVAQRTGLPVEKITVIKGDTDQVARGTGTYGSKSTQIGGVAAGQVSEVLVDKAKQLAADQLEASTEDMVLDLGAGQLHVAGAPEPGLSWADLASELHGSGQLAQLPAEADFAPAPPTFPFGAHLAVVEVDTDTGGAGADRRRRRRRHDHQSAGGRGPGPRRLGRRHRPGAVRRGPLRRGRQPQHANLVTYCFPSATELPFFELVDMETPTPINPLGAKGIGESGTIGATPAVHNAVIDALAPYAVRHLQMPVNGENVWRAIQNGKRA